MVICQHLHLDVCRGIVQGMGWVHAAVMLCSFQKESCLCMRRCCELLACAVYGDNVDAYELALADSCACCDSWHVFKLVM